MAKDQSKPETANPGTASRGTTSTAARILGIWALLALLCWVAFFNGLTILDPLDKTEALQIGIAQEMFRHHELVTPRWNFHPYFDKPVLPYWLAGTTYRLLGPHPTAARIPAALSASAAVIALFLSLWGAGGPAKQATALKRGLIGAGLLALSTGWIGFGRTAVHDIYLSTSITACLLLFWWGFCWPRSRSAQHGYAALIGLAMGTGFLAKGPLGVLFPGMIMGLYLLVSQDRGRSILRLSSVAITLGTLAAVITPWLVASIQANGTAFVSHFFGFSNLQRLTEAVDGHRQPIWFYIPSMALLCFPWTFHLLGTLPSLPALFKDQPNPPQPFTPLLQLNRLAAIWLVAGFSFFSLVQTKLPGYILPLIPAAALLTATAVSNPGEETIRLRAAAWMHRLTLASLASVAGLLLATQLGLLTAFASALKTARGLPVQLPSQSALADIATTALSVGALTLAIYGYQTALKNKIFVEILAFSILLIAVPQFQKIYFNLEQAPIIHLSEETNRLGGDATVIYALGKPRYSIVNHSHLPVIFSSPGEKPSTKPISSLLNWERHRNDSHALIIGPCQAIQALELNDNTRLRLLDRQSNSCLASLEQPMLDKER